MRVFRQFLLCGGLAMCPVALGAGQSGAVQAPQPPRTPQADSATHRPAEFAGAWTYNPIDSVNAATGRPERAPRSATSRTPLRGTGNLGSGAGAGGGRGTGNGGGASASGGPRVGDGGNAPDPSTAASDYAPVAIPADSSAVGPTFAMIQESRDLSRDLLEVPEALTIDVAGGRVTFIDDLERALSYPTDGSKQRYHLAASSFDAEVEWDGSQLRKRIQGAFGFRMTETYFLSSDGQRLFVVIRIGEQRKKTDPIVGVNRVYDRLPSR